MIGFDDICGLEEAKNKLKEWIILPIKFPQFFEERWPYVATLIYGAPGTGKSHLVKAGACEADVNFYHVRLSTINTRWLGDHEKYVKYMYICNRMIKNLFEMARSNLPAIIFLDELDCLCSHPNEYSRSMRTELFIQLENLKNINKGIWVIAETNRPWMLTIAIRRRYFTYTLFIYIYICIYIYIYKHIDFQGEYIRHSLM